MLHGTRWTLITLLIYLQQQSVRSNRAVEQFHNIHAKLDELHGKFTLRAQEIFYDLQQVAESDENYPLLAISAEIAEYESIWFETERKGLLSAEAAIIRFFVAESVPLEEILVNNDYLIDLVVWQAYEQSMNDQQILDKLERIRRRLFLYLRRYHSVPNVMDLARKYCLETIARIEAQKASVIRGFDVALDRYRAEVSIMYIEEYESAVLIAINALIDEALSILDNVMGHHGPGPIGDLLRAIEDSKQKTMDKLRHIDDKLVDSVKMSDVLAFEQRIVGDTVGVDSYTDEVDANMEYMDNELTSTMQDIFYEPQVLARRIESYTMIVLSAQMAEIEGLMHGDERRMLESLMALMEQKMQTFNKLHLLNRYTVDLVVLRLLEHSLDNALGRIVKRRKNMYLSLVRFDSMYGIEELARKYARRLYQRIIHLNEVRSLLSLFKRQPSIVTLGQEMLDHMNDLVRIGIVMWSSESNEAALLKATLGRALFNDITRANAESIKKKIMRFRQSAATVNAVSMIDVKNYEKGLLGTRWQVSNCT